ncbi:ATP-binding protein [Propionivibrio dicarboxylicus]|uniref:histidine kinase n=1 Tax=Propionivibrio dicarboxylicus TaxID=83767 RepID=A0A1G8BFF2_9RHOO|nr:ATP-binding protein [Propionivibrio dicarboxylicus]SDH31947.1 His Kinase A (phospho-acceptor) domain-containing protein [Propionivibrio dicarboxylicus]
MSIADTTPPGDEQALRAEIARLNKINLALMNRAERSTSAQNSQFGMFQTALVLEKQVQERTVQLDSALRDNEKINRDLQIATEQMEAEIVERKRALVALEHEKEEQRILIRKLEDAQNRLIQAEKMSAVGQLAAGIAHEINNPIGFITSNLGTLKRYTEDFLALIEAYHATQPALPAAQRSALDALRTRIDIDFLGEDVAILLDQSLDGLERVRRIVADLQDFSRVGESEWQSVDLHRCLDSTLNVVTNELRPKADIVRAYGRIPVITCMPFQLNQVFMSLIRNAAQAIDGHGTITLRTGGDEDSVWVEVEDDGAGIAKETLPRIFDPFFTTKPVGTAMGLGLSVSYGIVERHGGRFDVRSTVGKGSTFRITLPVRPKPPQA